jgi:hypothetical protein
MSIFSQVVVYFLDPSCQGIPSDITGTFPENKHIFFGLTHYSSSTTFAKAAIPTPGLTSITSQ